MLHSKTSFNIALLLLHKRQMHYQHTKNNINHDIRKYEHQKQMHRKKIYNLYLIAILMHDKKADKANKEEVDSTVQPLILPKQPKEG